MAVHHFQEKKNFNEKTDTAY